MVYASSFLRLNDMTNYIPAFVYIWYFSSSYYIFQLAAAAAKMCIHLYFNTLEKYVSLSIRVCVRINKYRFDSNEIQMKFKIFGYETSFLVQFHCLTKFQIIIWFIDCQNTLLVILFEFHTFSTFRHTHTHVRARTHTHICIIYYENIAFCYR